MRLRPLGVLVIACILALASIARPQDPVSGWQSDLDRLASELPRLHKNLFFGQPEPAFRAAVARLRGQLPSLNEDERLVGLMRLVASVGDAHTAVAYRPSVALPVMLYWFKDGLYVTNTVAEHGDALYGRIEAINGRPVTEVRQLFEAIIPHENEPQVWRGLASMAADTRLLHGLGVTPDATGATLTVRTADGRALTAVMKAMPLTARPSWMVDPTDTSDLPLYQQSREKFYWFRHLPEANAVYTKYNACQVMKDLPFADFARDVLAAIDQHAGARLIIDLRSNGGGDSSIAQPLIDGIGARPELARSGRLFVIIGRQTFSSAILNALALQQLGARLVGEPTGGKPNHYGELQRLALPATGLAVSYSTKYFRLLRRICGRKSMIP